MSIIYKRCLGLDISLLAPVFIFNTEAPKTQYLDSLRKWEIVFLQ